jgi:plastocyanin
MRWLTRSIPVLLLLVPASGAGPAVAGGPMVRVSAYDVGGFNLFSPATLDLPRGGTVVWDFDGPSTHTATDGTGMGLYDSDLVLGGGPSFEASFTAAGRYAVVCTLHEDMGGTVRVPTGVARSATTVGDAVTVRWAATTAAAGFVHDVQIRRPGQAWTPWRTGVVARTGTFVPARAGTFRFRARLRAPGTAHAAWSVPVDLSVM